MNKDIRVTHTLAVNNLRSVLGIGRPSVDMIFGILKNPIIRDVLIIVYYYQSRIFFNVMRSYSLP
jgi:hypothetical protein